MRFAWRGRLWLDGTALTVIEGSGADVIAFCGILHRSGASNSTALKAHAHTMYLTAAEAR